MSSDSHFPRSNPPFKRPMQSDSYAHRYASNNLADQRSEATIRELRDIFDSLESTPKDRKVAGAAIRHAWHAMERAGFSDFEQIKEVRTEAWPSAIEESHHFLIALALEIIGWYQFGLRPYDIDRTARIFDRCLELSPRNQRALLRFAIVVNTIKPEHLTGLARFPKKQKETALGYKLQCKTKIEQLLRSEFEIGEEHLVGQACTSVSDIANSREAAESDFIFHILGHLARLHLAVGDFFGNGTQLSLGIGAACCQLEMLGLSRDIDKSLSTLLEKSEDPKFDLIIHQKKQEVIPILKTLAELCECKWRIFKNHSSRRRALAIIDLCESIKT